MAKQLAIVGGGAAGFFAAATLAEFAPALRVIIFEKAQDCLAKVRISGGGRCNVTHACFDPKELARFYPRGGRELLGAFHEFQPRDTIAWFGRRGVALKTEPDGRMFPVTDRSSTVVDCLVREARRSGATIRTNCEVTSAKHVQDGFELATSANGTIRCDVLLLTLGGCRTPAVGQLAVQLGHTLASPVPSLFAMQMAEPWLKKLAGVSLANIEASAPGFGLRSSGAVVCTHNGLSGPAILKLSAFGARVFHEAGYKFPIHINWAPQATEAAVQDSMKNAREAHPARQVANTPLLGLPSRLWEALVAAAAVPTGMRWADLSRALAHKLVLAVRQTELQVVGKSLNRDEFVTCGGVPLSEVDMRTMQSKRCPGLYFAGEVLDIDALTGGFNFQAAWTTAWLAARRIARLETPSINPAAM